MRHLLNDPDWPSSVLAAVARYYGVSTAEIIGPDRHRQFALARQIAMYLMHSECHRMTYARIAPLFHRSTSAVCDAVSLVVVQLSHDATLRDEIARIRELREVMSRQHSGRLVSHNAGRTQTESLFDTLIPSV